MRAMSRRRAYACMQSRMCVHRKCVCRVNVHVMHAALMCARAPCARARVFVHATLMYACACVCRVPCVFHAGDARVR